MLQWCGIMCIIVHEVLGLIPRSGCIGFYCHKHLEHSLNCTKVNGKASIFLQETSEIAS